MAPHQLPTEFFSGVSPGESRYAETSYSQRHTLSDEYSDIKWLTREGCDNERTQPVCHRGRTGGHARMSRRLRAGDVAGKERGKT